MWPFSQNTSFLSQGKLVWSSSKDLKEFILICFSPYDVHQIVTPLSYKKEADHLKPSVFVTLWKEVLCVNKVDGLRSSRVDDLLWETRFKQPTSLGNLEGQYLYT